MTPAFVLSADTLTNLAARLPEGALSSAVKVVVTLAAGLFLAWALAVLVRRTLERTSPPERVALGRRVTFWGILALAIASAMGELGFNLSVLLGAAGIFTVAFGFASQTSASNLISGVFLVAERPFSVGDLVKIGGTSGEVIAVDLMSVKIRTFDNLFVRVPNETVMKAEITNLTRYPIRRVDLFVSVAYKEDLEAVTALLVTTADELPAVLDEPRPLVMFEQFGASGVDLKLAAWTTREEFVSTKADLARAVKRALDEAGIEIPFPHVSLYAGAASKPVPVQVVEPVSASSPRRG